MVAAMQEDLSVQQSNHPGMSKLDELSVQTIRFLSMDGVQKANSGHPGMPMGMAPAAYKLWTRHMKHNPANPKWHNRDRFVLSAGHGSMLIYSLLHLSGYDLPLEELKQFRQWDSKTPGHPEYGHTAGIEVTTGPLGQGISNAVGMAIAEKYLSGYFNRDGFSVVDYNIYAIAGDGCLQEGVSSEACSLAGTQKLDNLIVIYDDNHITIDGETELSFTENVAKRFEGYDWFVQEVDGDGNDMESFEKALLAAQKEGSRPSLIKFRTHIGFGSPNLQDSHNAHGSPLGDDEIALIKKNAGWDPEATFHIPEEVQTAMQQCIETGAQSESQWQELFENYAKAHPDLAEAFNTATNHKQPINLADYLPEFEAGKSVATRKASGDTLDALMPHLPLVLGGSADLTPSNNTQFKGAQDFNPDNRLGRYIRYGVREHGMGAVMNGIAVNDLLTAYGGTFFVFSDYMRASIRLAALSKYPTIFVFTHDSIGLGEDGPTHQPVEHLASFRAMPHLNVFRPADANETAQVWKFALENHSGPTVMCLTRQGLPVLDQDKFASAENVAKGAYVLTGDSNPQVVLMGTGSELSIALEAHQMLSQQGIRASVVSMPCWELFSQQGQAYRDSVIPPSVKARVAVEAGVRLGWDRWIGDAGEFVGLDDYGHSAPYKTIYENRGLTANNVVTVAKRSIDRTS